MRRPASILAVIALTLACVAPVLSQQKPEPLRGEDAYPKTVPADLPEKNPLAGDPEAIRMGMGFFRVRCGDCHGVDAKGMRAPDLTQIWASGRSDGSVFRTVRLGRPGTEMPPAVRLNDQDIWRVLAFLRAQAAAAPKESQRGSAESGEKIFKTTCNVCHRVNERGGQVGPDLSRIGAARSRAFLTKRIRGTIEEPTPGYDYVVLTLKNGQVINGVRKKEDLFSIQIVDRSQRVQGYLKEDLKSVVDGPKSMMPVFSPEKMSDSDLDDLLAYLGTLRGAAAAKAVARPADEKVSPGGDGEK